MIYKNMNKAETPGRADLQIGGNVGKGGIANPESEDPGGKSPIRRLASQIGSPGYWHSRGYLPHFESTGIIQHVTFHLADSLPKDVLERLEMEWKNLPPEKQSAEKRKRIETWMDAGHGSCVLRENEIAEMAQNAILFFDGKRYRLLAWVIMPNHMHVLFQPLNGWTVAKIVASWKKFTARKICDFRKANPAYQEKFANQEIGEPGVRADQEIGGPARVWHREYWDRYMRDERQLQQAIEYIHQNPVKAGLVETAEAWPWSSARYANQE
jgi:REP element-mobilizing transposase RayT